MFFVRRVAFVLALLPLFASRLEAAAPVSRESALESLKAFDAKLWLNQNGDVVKVYVHKSDFTDRELELLTPLRDLQGVVLHSTGVTEGGVHRLAAMYPRLRELGLAGDCINDTGMEAIAQMGQIESLSLASSAITKAGIENIRPLPLKSLELVNVGVDDEAMLLLQAFPNLHQLTIKSARVQGNGFVVLENLPKLTHLNVATTGFSDEHFPSISKLTALEFLHVGATKVSGRGLAQLVKMRSLKYLALNDCPIDDNGLANLPVLPQLEELLVWRTRITDASVPTFGRYRTLRRVFVSETRLSFDGVKQLKRLLPEARISHSFGFEEREEEEEKREEKRDRSDY